MKSVNLPKIMAIVLLTVLPFVIVAATALTGNGFLSFCAVAALPEGVIGYINEYDNGNLIQDTLYNNYQLPSDSGIGSSAVNAQDSVTVSVEEAVMGYIIKKTLSPYSAKYKYNNIYLSNSTGAEINVAEELSKPLDFKVVKSNEPQVLIYHTHTTESYMQSEEEYYTTTDEPRTTDETKNMVAVGEVVRQRLESAGFSVIHDKTIHAR